MEYYPSYSGNYGPGIVVGTATGYGLDGPGIESRWGGEIFRTCPDRPWGSLSLLYNGYRVFPWGKERPGRDADLSPPSSAVVKERVELYLYSPYGPYGLYRASVSVQGCTLPLPLPIVVIPGPTFRDNLSVPSRSFNKSQDLDFSICCPQTSARNYHYTLGNISEGRRSHLHRSGSLMSRIIEDG